MLAQLFPWMAKRPSVLSIVIALVFFALGRLFEAYGVLGPLADFTAYLERSLRSFDALSVASTFYRELTGCELIGDAIACAPGPDTTDRLQDTLEGKPQNGLLATLIVACFNTVTILFGQSTVLGILIWLVLLIASGVLIAMALDLDELGAFGIVLVIVLAPAAAGVVALALKWFLLLLVLIFSQTLAGIMFFVTTFGGFFAWVATANSVLSTAHGIDSSMSAKSGTTPPDPKA